MADEEPEEEQQTPLDFVMTPVFAGMGVLRRLIGGARQKMPPRWDGTKTRIEYRPCYRVVEWYGEASSHTQNGCGDPPHCSVPGHVGRHSEVRPDGLDWSGVHFSCLEEAFENQAFRQWYEHEGGRAVVDKGKMTLYPPYYGKDDKPPLPPYNFYLDEHLHEMSGQEIREYQRTGFVPKRFRRRGRTKPGSPPGSVQES